MARVALNWFDTGYRSKRPKKSRPKKPDKLTAALKPKPAPPKPRTTSPKRPVAAAAPRPAKPKPRPRDRVTVDPDSSYAHEKKPAALLKASAEEWRGCLANYDRWIRASLASAQKLAPKQAIAAIDGLNRLYDDVYAFKSEMVGAFGYPRIDALPENETFQQLQREHAAARFALEQRAKPRKRKP